MQTLRAVCSKVEPKISPRRKPPFPMGAGWPKFNHLEMDKSKLFPGPTNPVWWGSMHAISSYCGNRPTTHTHKQTNKQGRLQYTVPQLSVQCKNDFKV